MKMGCVSSKTDINDRHPNIFQVFNVNDEGMTVSPGKLQVTETELVWHQRGKQPTIWPLRALRKYGYDQDVFSFECGRRCKTGPGIYAFRCRKAEQLFNIVQQNITGNMVNVYGTDESHATDFPVQTAPIVNSRRMPSHIEGHLNPGVVRSHPTLSRPGSVSGSNGPTSPSPTSPPPVAPDLTPLEHNNNKRGSLVAEHSYTNATVLNEENGDAVVPNYENLDVAIVGVINSDNYVIDTGHVYMNVGAKDSLAKEMTETNQILAEPAEKHCYANIDVSDLTSVPPTPTNMNYAALDLSTTKKDLEHPPVIPESPTKEKKSYATIDFQKTNALSQSINPRMETEEGSRKTRHNSTISDITTRNSNSLSD